jgi:hypothetical protein
MNSRVSFVFIVHGLIIILIGDFFNLSVIILRGDPLLLRPLPVTMKEWLKLELHFSQIIIVIFDGF